MLGSLLASEAGHGAPSFDILSTLVVLPAVGAAVIALTPKSRGELHRLFAVLFTGATAALAVWLLTAFDAGDAGYQFVVDRSWVSEFGISWHVGVDGISLFLVVLTAVLFPIAILGATPHHDAKPYYAWLLLLEAGCLGVFVSLDLFMFFVMFEIVLVPMYFLIGGWGYANRVYAALKFFLFTMFGSALMLVAIVATAYLHRDAVEDVNRAEAQEIVSDAEGQPSETEADRIAELEAGQPLTFDLQEIAETRTIVDDSSGASPFDWSAARWIFLAFALAFAVKVPLFPVHTWLPDAHTEAPTAGSVILAGVLLKLGTYGLLRFGLYLFPDAANFFAPALVTLGVIGIIYGAIVATMQKDLKRLVAYSSVAHLGFIVLGTFAITTQGIQGGLLQNINHGLSTGALFLLVGMISERRHTREIAALRGLQKVAPIFAAVFTVVMLSSIGLPGLNGFVGEFLVLVGSFLTRRWWTVVAAAGVILAALYMLWAYQRVFHGHTDEDNEGFAELSWKEGAVLAPLLGLIVFLGIYPKPVLDRMQPAVDRLIVHVDENSDFVSPEVETPVVVGEGQGEDEDEGGEGQGEEADSDAADESDADEHAEAQP
ncbi:MAG TPA: NADH-quinone oxidoreductase subunit M [Acidimicrobiales bacterium]|nr:NADH-quinone oxidoreductase subunit M [Acidimicrobiales bacterium]